MTLLFYLDCETLSLAGVNLVSLFCISQVFAGGGFFFGKFILLWDNRDGCSGKSEIIVKLFEKVLRSMSYLLVTSFHPLYCLVSSVICLFHLLFCWFSVFLILLFTVIYLFESYFAHLFGQLGCLSSWVWVGDFYYY